jgi:hypothetical protein
VPEVTGFVNRILLPIPLQLGAIPYFPGNGPVITPEISGAVPKSDSVLHEFLTCVSSAKVHGRVALLLFQYSFILIPLLRDER